MKDAGKAKSWGVCSPRSLQLSSLPPRPDARWFQAVASSLPKDAESASANFHAKAAQAWLLQIQPRRRLKFPAAHHLIISNPCFTVQFMDSACLINSYSSPPLRQLIPALGYEVCDTTSQAILSKLTVPPEWTHGLCNMPPYSPASSGHLKLRC